MAPHPEVPVAVPSPGTENTMFADSRRAARFTKNQ